MNIQKLLIGLSIVFFISSAIWLFGVFQVGAWDEKSVKESIRRGNLIANSLEKYKSKYGVYPEVLVGVVPEFSSRVKPPVVGDGEWEYEKEGEGFYLGVNGVDLELDPVLYRTHENDEWYMDTR